MKITRLFIAVSLSALCNACSKQAKIQSPQDVVARVNETVITRSQVDAVSTKREEEIRNSSTEVESKPQIADIRKASLEDLINRELILQDFKSHNYKIPEKMIDDSIETIITDGFSGNRSAFLSTLERQGYTLEQFKTIQRDNIMLSAMRANILGNTPETKKEKKLNEWYASLRKKATITVY